MTQEYFLGADVPPDIHRFYQSVHALARREYGIHPGVNATAHILVKQAFALDETPFQNEAELCSWVASVAARWRRGPISVELGPVVVRSRESIALDVRGAELRAFIRHVQWQSWLRGMHRKSSIVSRPRLTLFNSLSETSFPTALELVSARPWKMQFCALTTLQLFRKGADGRWWVCGDDLNLAHQAGRRWW